MARYGKTIYTLIEFGTDKICVMYGTRSESGRPEVLSFAQRPSAGSVYKGAIQDYNAVMKILSRTLKDADQGLRLSGERGPVFFLLNGPGIVSRQGEGSVMIGGAEKKVTPEHVTEAIARAKSLPSSADQVNFGIYDSYFVLNGTIRIKDPIGKLADRLDAFVHILSVERKRIDQVNAMLRELGFEQGGDAMSAAIASVFSVLTVEERDMGALLVDMGAGVTTYAVVAGDGAQFSGVIPVGVNNIANDLHVGLDLPFEYCLSFLRESRLRKLRESGVGFLEYSDRALSRQRRIPLDSFEKIIGERLRETFGFIRSAVEPALPDIGTGCVLTGGGSMIDSACEILGGIMEMRVRRGEPSGHTGAMTEFQYAPCCYSALFGMLEYALISESEESGGSVIGQSLAGFIDGVFSRWKKTAGGLGL